jgi:hypothetical protein
MDRKTGEKAESLLTPYRKEDWTRKSAVSFDSTYRLIGRNAEGHLAAV